MFVLKFVFKTKLLIAQPRSPFAVAAPQMLPWILTYKLDPGNEHLVNHRATHAGHFHRQLCANRHTACRLHYSNHLGPKWSVNVILVIKGRELWLLRLVYDRNVVHCDIVNMTISRVRRITVTSSNGSSSSSSISIHRAIATTTGGSAAAR